MEKGREFWIEENQTNCQWDLLRKRGKWLFEGINIAMPNKVKKKEKIKKQLPVSSEMASR